MSKRRFLTSIALLAALTLVATACGTDEGAEDQRQEGGNIIVASEQFPDCLNVVDACSNASWLHWAIAQNVLPKAMTLDPQNNFVASPVLAEAPTLANGGLKEDPFTVTYKINPQAVWDDGTPITSADFEFTWHAMVDSKDSLSTLGYDQIEKIDTSDPATAVITFKNVYADWPDLFGGQSTNGYILKKAAFEKQDVSGTMQTDIPFSGGPWVLDSFTKDQQAILKRNDKYWGTKAIADQITIVAREEQSTEIQQLFTGEVYAAYPQPKDPGFRKQFEGKPGVKVATGSGSTYEALWINMERKPMDDVKVRQAFAYAVDRQAVVDFLIKPDDPSGIVLNCGGWVPTVGDWCDNTDFAQYTYQPDKAKTLLQEAGWTCPASGTCTKGGDELNIVVHTTSGNKGRADTLSLIKEKMKTAGFDMEIKTLASPSPIFTDFMPKRQHMVALFANVASPDPTVTTILSLNQIPKADGTGGQNWSGWRNTEATNFMEESDKTLDPAKRKELLQKVGDLEAQELPLLPLYQKPLFVIWRDDKIGGPIDDYVTSPLSALYNIHEWYLLKA